MANPTESPAVGQGCQSTPMLEDHLVSFQSGTDWVKIQQHDGSLHVDIFPRATLQELCSPSALLVWHSSKPSPDLVQEGAQSEPHSDVETPGPGSGRAALSVASSWITILKFSVYRLLELIWIWRSIRWRMGWLKWVESYQTRYNCTEMVNPGTTDHHCCSASPAKWHLMDPWACAPPFHWLRWSHSPGCLTVQEANKHCFCFSDGLKECQSFNNVKAIIMTELLPVQFLNPFDQWLSFEKKSIIIWNGLIFAWPQSNGGRYHRLSSHQQRRLGPETTWEECWLNCTFQRLLNPKYCKIL